MAAMCCGVVPQHPPMHAGTCMPEGQGIIAKVFRRSRVHDAPANLFRPTGVGHDRETRIRNGLAHLLEDAQDLVRSAGTIDADDISASFIEARATLAGSSPNRVRSSRVKVMEAMTGKFGVDWHGGMDGFADFVQVSHGLDDQQVDTCRLPGQRFVPRKLRGPVPACTRPKGARRTPKRTDVTGNQNILERGHDDPAGQFNPGGIDFSHFIFQPMPGQLEAVGAKGVGLDDLAPASIYSR